MLIVALILAMIGLAALVTAVVTSNELIAWLCIGASGLGILLLIVDAIRDRAQRRAEFPAAIPATTVEATETPVEITEVIEPVQTTDIVEDETPVAAEYFTDESVEESAEVHEGIPAEVIDEIPDGPSGDVPDGIAEDIAPAEEFAEDIAEEDHPDELIYDDPDHDTPSDDEADYPEPAEEAAIHTVDESDLAQQDDDEDGDEIGTDIASAIGDVAEIEDVSPDGDESATEVRYISSPESSAHTVVYTVAESAETEYVDTEDSPVGEEPRDR